MESKIWISKDILKWNTYSQGGSIIEKQFWQRSYEIWEHSNNLIENANNKFQLADGITNLKRCLNHRLQLIEKLYNFKLIEIENKPKGYLELLQRYGIVRPTIMKIRNEIEHNDENPPDLVRCKEFVDVLWYFLKSTDSIVQIKKDEIESIYYDSDDNETQYWYSTELQNENGLSVEIRGCFPKEITFYNQQANTFKIIIKEKCSKEKFTDCIKSLEIASDIISDKEILDTDLFISGELKLEHKDVPNFINIVINAY